MSNDLNMTIREARLEDLDGVLEIYNYYVTRSHVTFDIVPWTREQCRQWFGGFRPTGPHRLWVAEQSGVICGYASSTRLRPKPAYDISVETTIYMAIGAQGRGAGKKLYGALLASLETTGLHRAFAAIALPNPASIALHEGLGFRRAGCFGEAGFKFGRYWDIGWYQRSLAPD